MHVKQVDNEWNPIRLIDRLSEKRMYTVQVDVVLLSIQAVHTAVKSTVAVVN